MPIVPTGAIFRHSTCVIHPSWWPVSFLQSVLCCKAAPLNGSHGTSEVVTDVDSSSSPRQKEKFEEDGENDEILGGIFAFSEEDLHSLKNDEILGGIFSLRMENPLEKKKKGRTSIGSRSLISRKSISLDHVIVPETVFGLSEKPICSFQGHSDDVLDL